MKEDAELLDEVVVIGYGSARKGDLTGPISSVKGASLTERSTQMLSTAMQGQISGVEVLPGVLVILLRYVFVV